MTTAIEETKREMYAKLARTKHALGITYGGRTQFPEFEAALEAHLEELRKDLNFACAALDVETARRTKLVQERDDIQLRLHAIDHAYFVQSEANRVAGEQLREAQKTIAELSKAVAALYVAQNKRKDLGATMTLAEAENVSNAATEGLVSRFERRNDGKCDNPSCSECKS